MTDLLSAKRDLRRVMQTKRGLLAAHNPNAATDLVHHALKKIAGTASLVIAAYHVMGSEINPGPLLTTLHQAGHKLALPVIAGKGVPLIFRSYTPGDMLVAGPMGILEPGTSALKVEPDIVLTALLAFDRQRYRLGYGGGYYDRTLTALRQRKRILALGLAYAGQEVPETPIEPHDVQLDYIATEAGLI